MPAQTIQDQIKDEEYLIFQEIAELFSATPDIAVRFKYSQDKHEQRAARALENLQRHWRNLNDLSDELEQ